MKNIGQRLGKLESVMQTQRPAWAFVLDNGTQFYPAEFPIAYLSDHGPVGPSGRRIVRCEHPVFEGGVLQAIFATVDAWIALGAAPWNNEC